MRLRLVFASDFADIFEVRGTPRAERGYQHPVGEWNFQEVTVRGPTIQVELNGTVILDTDVSTIDMSKVMSKKGHPGKDRTRGFFGFADPSVARTGFSPFNSFGGEKRA